MAKDTNIISELKKLPDNLVMDRLLPTKSDLSQLEQFLITRLKKSNDTLIDTQIALDEAQDNFEKLVEQLSDDL